MRKRYALVGTGGRAVMYLDAVCGTYAEDAVLVGLCDVSTTRMDFHNSRLGHKFGVNVPQYPASDFDRMITETHPDAVIVTSVDATHHDYIVKAMEGGCDAITEKPMTTDDEKARAIFDAIARTGRSLRVCFNYRYIPAFTKLREVVRDGLIGLPTLIDFSWMLDTRHGADYFRRWHREKEHSGGLLVHKATHHFDLVNWWIDDWPAKVFAMGRLAFYGRANAEARGESYAYDRYTGVAEAAADPFALTLDSHRYLRGLYLDAEPDNGYLRDRNVFGEGITAEDTMAVTARYRGGAVLSYCLVAYSPWEGLRVAITGTKGRVELFEKGGSHIVAVDEPGDGGERWLRLYPMFGAPEDIAIPAAEGGHGGGDPVMLEQIFSPTPPPDPFRRAASHLDGAASILVGISANHSIATGQAVNCDDLVPLPARS
jgi:predicted dehydrogenase